MIYLIQTVSCVISAILSTVIMVWTDKMRYVQYAVLTVHCALSPVVTLWMDHFGWQRLSHLPRPSLPYFNHAPVTLVSILCSCHTLAYVTFVFTAHANNSHRAIILPDLDTSHDL